MNENVFWLFGVYDLLVILYLFDEDLEIVVVYGCDFLMLGVEDVVFCYLCFFLGKIVYMYFLWFDLYKMWKLIVVGCEKMVVFDDMEFEWKVMVYEKLFWKCVEIYGEW